MSKLFQFCPHCGTRLNLSPDRSADGKLAVWCDNIKCPSELSFDGAEHYDAQDAGMLLCEIEIAELRRQQAAEAEAEQAEAEAQSRQPDRDDV